MDNLTFKKFYSPDILLAEGYTYCGENIYEKDGKKYYLAGTCLLHFFNKEEKLVIAASSKKVVEEKQKELTESINEFQEMLSVLGEKMKTEKDFYTLEEIYIKHIKDIFNTGRELIEANDKIKQFS